MPGHQPEFRWWQKFSLTHWGLVTPFGDINLGQHWRHQAITWTNVDLSSARSSYIHLMAISQEIHQSSVTKLSMKITQFKISLKSPRGQWVKVPLAIRNFNSMWPCDAIWHWGSWPALVLVITCHLISAKPLPEPVLTYCWVDSEEYTSVKLKSKHNDFLSKKLVWKCHLQNVCHFVQASMP